jgi:hypothetical protein
MIAALALTVVAGCASDPGARVADRIRAANSGAVQEVVYQPRNILDPAEIDVFLRPGVTVAETDRLWCKVIEPAGGSDIEGATGVAVWNDVGSMTAPPQRSSSQSPDRPWAGTAPGSAGQILLLSGGHAFVFHRAGDPVRSGTPAPAS